MPKKVNLDSPVKRKIVSDFLENLGLKLIRCKGDHFAYNKVPKIKRPIILILIDLLPNFYVKQILKQIGSSKKEFLEVEIVVR